MPKDKTINLTKDDLQEISSREKIVIPEVDLGVGDKIGGKYIGDEAITNKKITSVARAYTAIVGATGDVNYDNIQDAIDYCNGLGGGRVYIKPGVYTLTDNLTLYNNIILEGQSPQTTAINFNTNAKSVLIKGTDYYATGTVSISVGGRTVVGVGTAWSANLTTGHYILLGNSNWFQIIAVTDDTHITIANKYFGKNLSGDNYKAAIIKNNVSLRNLSVVYSGTHGIDTQYTNNLRINNVFSLYHAGDALKLDVSNWNVLNYIILAHSGGSGFYTNEMYNSSCDRLFIFNNTGSGFVFEGNSEDNSFAFLKSYSNAAGAEIKSSISNTFARIDTKYNTNEGILINGGSHTSIDAITMDNGADGIKLLGNSDNIIISGCLIKDNGAWGVNVSAATCDNTLIEGNEFSGNTSGAITDNGTGTKIGINIGDNSGVTTETSSATPTINTDNLDAHSITALASAITSMTTNLSGTPTNFDKLLIRIKDNGTARAITWGTDFQDGSVALPTTTVAGKTLMIGLIYDSVDSKWTCEATGSRA
ncbi:MAG: right-handed parallel beta-helix repeat-containing protein [Patescibacteria group bacterium]|jgi:hypothetical protein|nr:right-handed parallel beta-helix repeat-containing protein [Patescibacteria group bacterium]